MNASEQATDILAAQECESLAACVAREQPPASYADVVAKLKGHADNLPPARREFWIEQAKALGVTLYPLRGTPKPKFPPNIDVRTSKPEASSSQ